MLTKFGQGTCVSNQPYYPVLVSCGHNFALGTQLPVIQIVARGLNMGEGGTLAAWPQPPCHTWTHLVNWTCYPPSLNMHPLALWSRHGQTFPEQNLKQDEESQIPWCLLFNCECVCFHSTFSPIILASRFSPGLALVPGCNMKPLVKDRGWVRGATRHQIRSFYRTQVYLGSDLWVRVSQTN